MERNREGDKRKNERRSNRFVWTGGKEEKASEEKREIYVEGDMERERSRRRDGRGGVGEESDGVEVAGSRMKP